MKIQKGNIGEWSEIYTFLKLLGLKKLYAADANVNKLDNTYFDIKSVERIEPIGNFKYVVNIKDDTVSVIDEDNDQIIVRHSCADFDKAANSLFNELQKTHKSAFELPDTSKFLSEINVGTIKSKSGDKSDIHIEIHDINTGYETVQGFSIKSQLGNPSTLVNASKSTNFVFRITGNIDKIIIDSFNNSELNFKDKFKILTDGGVKLQFDHLDNPIFNNNLLLIDSNLVDILAFMIINNYVNGVNLVSDSLELLNSENPLCFDLNVGQPFYEYKVKKFLSDSALGMRSSIVWDGRTDANGGYIIVRKDGEVLCYHLYNHDEFQEYLVKNTKFETPSTTRHDFGYIYEVDGQYYIKLNLQIRFLK